MNQYDGLIACTTSLRRAGVVIDSSSWEFTVRVGRVSDTIEAGDKRPLSKVVVDAAKVRGVAIDSDEYRTKFRLGNTVLTLSQSYLEPGFSSGPGVSNEGRPSIGFNVREVLW